MFIRKLSHELEEFAKAEIREIPERVENDLKDIKEWLKNQEHINARMDDQWLMAFLRGCKFNKERVKEKLDKYYTLRSLLPEFFRNRDPYQQKIQDILSRGSILPLPISDPKSPRVVLSQCGHYDLKNFNVYDIFKVQFMILDILLFEDDNFVIAGMNTIQDLSGITYGHLSINPLIIKKVMTCMQYVYPIRIVGLDFINVPSFFSLIYKVFKPFLSEKIRKRILVHDDKKGTLYEKIPRRIFTQEYGGDVGTNDELAAVWKKKIESYAEWFKEDENYCTYENLRPGKPRTLENVLGMNCNIL